jgi:hypothetical protein
MNQNCRCSRRLGRCGIGLEVGVWHVPPAAVSVLQVPPLARGDLDHPDYLPAGDREHRRFRGREVKERVVKLSAGGGRRRRDARRPAARRRNGGTGAAVNLLVDWAEVLRSLGKKINIKYKVSTVVFDSTKKNKLVD